MPPEPPFIDNDTLHKSHARLMWLLGNKKAMHVLSASTDPIDGDAVDRLREKMALDEALPEITDEQREAGVIELLECGRRKCGHIFSEFERKWVKDPECSIARQGVCPVCGERSVYHLSYNGSAVSRIDDVGPLKPESIEPSPRLGPTKRGLLLEAKRRALKLFAS